MKRWLCLSLFSLLPMLPFQTAIAAERSPLTMRQLAGQYTSGDEFLPGGDRLTLERSGLFEYLQFGCSPIIRATIPPKSQATLQGSVLTLKKSQPNLGGNGKPLPDTFYPIRWGKRIYVVRADMMDDFCDAVNGGDEPRHKERGSVFMLKRGHWSRRVAGLPEVPAAYRNHLLAKPLVGTLTHVGWNGFSGEVNLGSDDGVWKGMTIYPYVNAGADSGRWMAKVTEVKEHSCRLMVSHDAHTRIRLQANQPVYTRSNP